MYPLFNEYRRKGYGEEAAAAFSKAYPDGKITGKMEKMTVAETMSDNDPASALLEKPGFVKQETVLRFGSEEMSEVLGFIRFGLTAGKKRKKGLPLTRVYQLWYNTFGIIEPEV